MKKRNKTKDIIIVMVVLSVVISAVLIAVKALSASANNTQQDVTSVREWSKIATEIQYMAESADLGVHYVNSNKRVAIDFIGSEGYYQLQYNTNTKMLYLMEGTYPSNVTTDEMKISEATYGTKNGDPYAENVLAFSVSGADSNGTFPDGVMNVNLSVEVGGKLTRNDVKVTLPQATE